MSIGSSIALTSFGFTEFLSILASEHWNGVLWDILGPLTSISSLMDGNDTSTIVGGSVNREGGQGILVTLP